MQLGIRPGAEASLSRRLAWLTALRLLVLTMFLIATVAIRLGGFNLGGFSSRFALGTTAAAYGLAAVYAILLRVGKHLSAIAYAQLITDQITWTAIVYISGGATSGATSLYGLTCLSGAILLGVRGALAAAASGAGWYVLLCAGFWLHFVSPPTDQQVTYLTQLGEMSYPVFVNLLGMAAVTLLASYLADRLHATGGDLALANARAKQSERLALLGRVAAGLAHEIRNPLGSIAGSIELLRTGSTLSDEDRHLCEIIERETARLNELVGDMLDLSRPREPSKVTTDLGTIAREVVLLASRSGRGVEVLVTYVGPDELLVIADPAQLRQIVWNLVRNAIQASAPGDSVVVRVSSGSDGHVLAITDRGQGIPKEARERLFDAFFTTRSQGMGIGLAVVKRIVDDHGFAIDVESEEGKGTTFSVRIPVSLALREEETSARAAEISSA